MEKSINVNRYNLSDITFLIPIRLDSISRLENLILSINSLQKYFITNIKVLEADKHNNHILERQPNGVEYDFIENFDTKEKDRTFDFYCNDASTSNRYNSP